MNALASTAFEFGEVVVIPVDDIRQTKIVVISELLDEIAGLKKRITSLEFKQYERDRADAAERGPKVARNTPWGHRLGGRKLRDDISESDADDLVAGLQDEGITETDVVDEIVAATLCRAGAADVTDHAD
jgi:hypothetical protein